jgi:hypothetical protein
MHNHVLTDHGQQVGLRRVHTQMLGSTGKLHAAVLTPCHCIAGCSWFKFDSISQTEQRLMPDWFNDRSETRLPSVSVRVP